MPSVLTVSQPDAWAESLSESRLKEIVAQLHQRRHDPIQDTLKWLQSVVRGYFQYHAIPGNWERLQEFRKNVLRMAPIAKAAESQEPLDLDPLSKLAF